MRRSPFSIGEQDWCQLKGTEIGEYLLDICNYSLHLLSCIRLQLISLHQKVATSLCNYCYTEV